MLCKSVQFLRLVKIRLQPSGALFFFFFFFVVLSREPMAGKQCANCATRDNGDCFSKVFINGHFLAALQQEKEKRDNRF